ncbi:MAG: hypothetical protein K2Q20_08945, partial [Phycisphaerales bacterium]|nr:hypothetical protein [Phycisphaerales bacterium]
DAKGATVTIPDEVTQELVTNVNVRDGQTVVLGGLFTENMTFTRRQVPWAGDLPIIGAAFRGNEDSTVRSEIIFLITPTIVTDTMLAGAADRAGGDIDRIRTGTRQGLLPWSREKMTDTLNVEAEKLAREGNFDKALWNLQRSLSLNSNQPEAYRLRERITGQRERWGTSSMLEDINNSNETKRHDFTPPSPSPEHHKPKGSVRPVLEPTPAPRAAIPPSAYVEEQRQLALVAQAQAALAASTAGSDGNNNSTPNNAVASTAASSPSGNAEPANTGSMSTGNNPGGDTAAASPATNFTPSDINAAFAQVSGTSPATPSPNTATPLNTTTFADAANLNTPASATMPAAPAATNAPSTQQAKADTNKPAYTPPVLSDPEKKQVAQVSQTLPGLRGQVELFKLMNSGQAPELGKSADHNGWEPLVAASLIKTLPANPYIGGDNAQKIVVGDKPDSAFHSDYGWIYNPKTGQLWAAGFDAADRPLSKATSPDNAFAAKPAPAPAAEAKPADKPQNPEPATAGVETKPE